MSIWPRMFRPEMIAADATGASAGGALWALAGAERAIEVTGEVKSPGWVALHPELEAPRRSLVDSLLPWRSRAAKNEKVTVVSAIQAAGGTSNEGCVVSLQRKTSKGVLTSIEIDLRPGTKDFAKGMVLQPGDRLVVHH